MMINDFFILELLKGLFRIFLILKVFSCVNLLLNFNGGSIFRVSLSLIFLLKENER